MTARSVFVLLALSVGCSPSKRAACERVTAIIEPALAADSAPAADAPLGARQEWAKQLDTRARELEAVEFPDTRGEPSVSALVVAADMAVAHLDHLRDTYRAEDSAKNAEARKTDIAHWNTMLRGEATKIRTECGR